MAWKDNLSDSPPKMGTARRAVLSHQEDIRDALAKGYTKLAIWEAMSNDNAMPASYASFCKALKSTGISTDKADETKAKTFVHDPEKGRQKKLI